MFFFFEINASLIPQIHDYHAALELAERGDLERKTRQARYNLDILFDKMKHRNLEKKRQASRSYVAKDPSKTGKDKEKEKDKDKDKEHGKKEKDDEDEKDKDDSHDESEEEKEKNGKTKSKVSKKDSHKAKDEKAKSPKPQKKKSKKPVQTFAGII